MTIVTRVPTEPIIGEKNVEAFATTKLLVLVAEPVAVFTVIGPVVAPRGTNAVIWVEEIGLNRASVPLNSTLDTVLRLVPAIATCVPKDPLVGEKLVMVGRVFCTVETATSIKPPPVTRGIGIGSNRRVEGLHYRSSTRVQVNAI